MRGVLLFDCALPESRAMDAARRRKPKDVYRNYDDPARDTVREFYRLNHAHQTFDFVVAKKAEYLRLDRREMTWWDALDYLNTLVDDSDPDIALANSNICCKRPKRFAPTVIQTGSC